MTSAIATGILADNPARGESKGIARRNVRLVGSKPLPGWTIEAARAARIIFEKPGGRGALRELAELNLSRYGAPAHV
jgi:hypothetical protein